MDSRFWKYPDDAGPSDVSDGDLVDLSRRTDAQLYRQLTSSLPRDELLWLQGTRGRDCPNFKIAVVCVCVSTFFLAFIIPTARRVDFALF